MVGAVKGADTCAEDLARVRSNQRRSRARHKEYVQELEDKVRRCERQGVQATEAMQAAARELATENAYLKELLRCHGIHVPKTDLAAAAPPTSVHKNLLSMNYRGLVGHVKTARLANVPPATVTVPGPLTFAGHTPPGSGSSSQTYSPQRTDLSSGSPGNATQWLVATPSLESLELQLPAASLPPYHEQPGVGHVHSALDPATSYNVQSYEDFAYANLLATSYMSTQPTAAWSSITGPFSQAIPSSIAPGHASLESNLITYPHQHSLPPSEEGGTHQTFTPLHGHGPPIPDQ